MNPLFSAEINALPINGFIINGFGITAFRTYTVMPLDAGQFSAMIRIPSDGGDDCCDAIMVPPAKAPLRTPWGSTRWLR